MNTDRNQCVPRQMPVSIDQIEAAIADGMAVVQQSRPTWPFGHVEFAWEGSYYRGTAILPLAAIALAALRELTKTD